METDLIRLNAVSRRDAALAEARRWDDFLVMYDEVRPSAPSPPRTSEQHHQRSPRVVGALAKTEEAAVQILRDAGKALPTRELLARLLLWGVDIGGRDQASTLSARLSRAPTLVNNRPHGWMLREGIPKGDEATDPLQGKESVASETQPQDADDHRTEVAHADMTLPL